MCLLIKFILTCILLYVVNGLYNERRKNREMSKGFTLIELLVVIAIIGIISSVVLASFSKAREEKRLQESSQFRGN